MTFYLCSAICAESVCVKENERGDASDVYKNCCRAWKRDKIENDIYWNERQSLYTCIGYYFPKHSSVTGKYEIGL